MNYIAPTHDDIAARAFERFVERGSGHGHDLEDWLQAERELLEIRTAALDEHDVDPDAVEISQPEPAPTRRTRTAVAR
jgi:hypothetical protein